MRDVSVHITSRIRQSQSRRACAESCRQLQPHANWPCPPVVTAVPIARLLDYNRACTAREGTPGDMKDVPLYHRQATLSVMMQAELGLQALVVRLKRPVHLVLRARRKGTSLFNAQCRM
jgi:hypothetical protein